MARPPEYARLEEPTRDATAVRAAVKHLAPEDRARLMTWMLLYYQDDGSMFSPQISRRRRRITIDGVEYWLARIPQRS